MRCEKRAFFISISFKRTFVANYQMLRITQFLPQKLRARYIFFLRISSLPSPISINLRPKNIWDKYSPYSSISSLGYRVHIFPLCFTKVLTGHFSYVVISIDHSRDIHIYFVQLLLTAGKRSFRMSSQISSNQKLMIFYLFFLYRHQGNGEQE